MTEKNNEQAHEDEDARTPEESQQEPSLEKEVSEGRALAERAGEKAGKKLGKKAENRLRDLSER